jgi:hypothetical protein
VHEYEDLIQDLKRAPTLKDKLKYLFLSPGWSHDGKDQRANTLRREVGL